MAEAIVEAVRSNFSVDARKCNGVHRLWYLLVGDEELHATALSKSWMNHPATIEPTIEVPIQQDRPIREAAARSTNIDRLRIIALYEVVLYHGASEERYLIFEAMGLTTFLLITTLLSALSAQRHPHGEYIVNRLRFFLGPFIFWSAFYGVFMVLAVLGALTQGVSLDEVSGRSMFSPWMILYGGTSIHLWYVPFAFFAGVAMVGLLRLTKYWPLLPVMVGAFSLGIVTHWSMSLISIQYADLPLPIPQNLYAIASVFVGFALMVVLCAERGAQRTQLYVWLAILSVAFGAFSYVYDFIYMNQHYMGLRYCVIVWLVVLAFRFPGRSDPVTRFIAPLSFGVYLLHFAFVHLLVGIASGVESLNWMLEHAYMRALIVYAVSIACVAGLKKTRMRRFV